MQRHQRPRKEIISGCGYVRRKWRVSCLLAEEGVLLQKLPSRVQHPGMLWRGAGGPLWHLGPTWHGFPSKISPDPIPSQCKELLFVLSARNRRKRGWTGHPQPSGAEGKSSVPQGCCGGGWRQHPARAHGCSRSMCHPASPFCNC